MNKKLELKLIEIFCNCDDFCKLFEEGIEEKLLRSHAKCAGSRMPGNLSMCELMCIEIFYHLQGSKCFKYYYANFVEVHLKSYFPGLVSYSRFVQLKPRLMLYLFCFVLAFRLGRETGTYYVDSGKLAVCHNLRIRSNKVFKGIARRGKTSVGWFYGLKLHLIVNEFGELASFIITPGNVADNNFQLGLKLCRDLCGKLFGDKGYISHKLQEGLAKQGLFLVTKARKNMKGRLLSARDNMLLNKRGMIESVIDMLKHICDIEHSRHRSPVNAIVNVFAGLAAYSFLDHKPSIKNKRGRVYSYISENMLAGAA